MSSDLRALGRVHRPAGRSVGAPDRFSGPTRAARRGRRVVRRRHVGYGVRRRPPVPPVLSGLVVVAVALVAYLGFAAEGGSEHVTDPAGATQQAVPERPEGSDVARSVRADEAGDPPTFARAEDLEIAAPHAEPLAIAFREATRAEAVELRPTGSLVRNDNPAKYDPVADEPEGPEYHVLASLGRARPATSAADVVVPAGAQALAPVDGTVVEVREYVLHGSTRDWRIAVEPDDAPGLHVVLVHITDPRVRPGDEVSQGVTQLGTIRELPFASEVADLTDHDAPYVQLEVKPAGPPEPLDPNEPAIPAEEPSDA